MKTRDLLKSYLIELLGRVTIPMTMFKGTDHIDPGIPAGYFASDRLKGHPNAPVNKLAGDRLVQLTEIVLHGRSGFDRKKSIECLRVYFLRLMDTENCILNDRRLSLDQLADLEIHFVHQLVNLTRDNEEVEDELLSSVLRQAVSQSELESVQAIEEPNGRLSGLSYGVTDYYFRVEDVGYSYYINSVENNLEVVHFHGLTWTNWNREFLIKCLSRKSVMIRVGILSPESPFYNPYAQHIGIEESKLRDKTYEVIEIWKSIYASASSSSDETADIKIYFTLGFPAKSMYRFDDSIIVTPTTNAGPKGQFMSFRCVQTEPDSAFSIYKKEMDWLFETGSVIWSSSNPK